MSHQGNPISWLFHSLPLRMYGDRRLGGVLVFTILALGGFYAVQMPRMEDPTLTQRAVSITTLLPGADAAQVEAKVTDKLEGELRKIPELQWLRSQSRPDASWISFEIKDEVSDPAEVWAKINQKVEQAKAWLPPGASEPIVEDIIASAYTWIGAVVLDPAGAASERELRRAAVELKDALQQIPGTKSVDLFGEPEEQIWVGVDARQAARLGLSMEAIAALLHHNDAKDAAGVIRHAAAEQVVRLDNHLRSLEDVRNSVLRQGADGEVLRLRDIAVVRRQVKSPARSQAMVDGCMAIVVGVRLDTSMSIDAWTAKVEEKIAGFQRSLPAEIQLTPLLVQRDFVRTRLLELVSSLVLGVVAVCVVTFLFMGMRAAVLVSLALPLTSCMVLVGMGYLGIPLHQMSVTGLVLSLGLLVDNAIVVVDEVDRLAARGDGPGQIIRTVVDRFLVPLTGSTLTTALAFYPIAFMPGPTGEFVGSIGVTVILSVVSSLALSLGLLLPLATLLIGRRGGEKSISGREAFWRHGIRMPGLHDAYQRTLRYLFERPMRGMAVGCVLPLLGGLASLLLPEQFFPTADRNQFQIEVELSASAGLTATREQVELVEQIVREVQPGVKHTSWYFAASGPAFYYNQLPLRSNTPSYARGIVETHGRYVDKQSLQQLQRELSDRVLAAQVTVRLFEQGPPLNAPIEIRVFGQDAYELQEIGTQLKQRLLETAGVINVRSDLSETRPRSLVQVDPTRVRLAGLTERNVAEQIYAQLEGVRGGYLLEDTDEVPVMIQPINHGVPLTELKELTVSSPLAELSDKSAPLNAFATVSLVPERAAISRINGERVNELQAFLGIGVLPSEVLAKFAQGLADDPIALPFNYRIEYGGEASGRTTAVANLMAGFPPAAIGVIACLILALKSVRLTGIILVVAWLALGSGVGSLWLLGCPLGFTAIVGCIGLVGVAINDSIIILAALRESGAKGGDSQLAAQEVTACTRHVLCTTLTTMAGFLPLVISGGEFWPPLAIVIGVGIIGATISALTFIPCSYLYLASFSPGWTTQQANWSSASVALDARV